MALAAGTGYLVNLIYYVSTGTVKMVDEIPVPSLMALTSLMGNEPQISHGHPGCPDPDFLVFLSFSPNV